MGATGSVNPAYRGAALACCIVLLAGCGAFDLPRAGEGGGVLRAVPPSVVGDRIAEDSLRVVSWNVEYARKLDVALREIAGDPRLAGADLYCFQELDLAGARRMTEALGAAGVYFVASVRPRRGVELGNAVISRWPIVDARRVRLPGGGGWKGSPRTATVADVEIRGARVRVVSVHTSTFVLSPDARSDQARATLSAISDFEGPTIVAGDFNTAQEGDERALRRLFRDLGFTPARILEHSTVESRWRAALLWHDRLDHAFHRGFTELDAGVVRGTGASDHRPVWLVLAWPPDEASRTHVGPTHADEHADRDHRGHE